MSNNKLLELNELLSEEEYNGVLKYQLILKILSINDSVELEDILNKLTHISKKDNLKYDDFNVRLEDLKNDLRDMENGCCIRR